MSLLKSGKSLADQYAEALESARVANERLTVIQSEYFADRRVRAKAGEELEPLECPSEIWSVQLGREATARANGVSHREAVAAGLLVE